MATDKIGINCISKAHKKKIAVSEKQLKEAMRAEEKMREKKLRSKENKLQKNHYSIGDKLPVYMI